MKIIIAALAALSVGACATVTRGTTDQVTFTSEPPEAEVRTSIGYSCPATPCTFEVSRKSEFIATFSKEGYEPLQIPVQTRVAGTGAAGFAGNVILGGVVGMAVDAGTGATLEHYPNPVHASLVPLALPSGRKRLPAKPRRQIPTAQAPTQKTPWS
jgi:hypothetical protein